jgi:hypothetical protein
MAEKLAEASSKVGIAAFAHQVVGVPGLIPLIVSGLRLFASSLNVGPEWLEICGDIYRITERIETWMSVTDWPNFQHVRCGSELRRRRPVIDMTVEEIRTMYNDLVQTASKYGVDVGQRLPQAGDGIVSANEAVQAEMRRQAEEKRKISAENPVFAPDGYTFTLNKDEVINQTRKLSERVGYLEDLLPRLVRYDQLALRRDRKLADSIVLRSQQSQQTSVFEAVIKEQKARADPDQAATIDQIARVRDSVLQHQKESEKLEALEQPLFRHMLEKGSLRNVGGGSLDESIYRGRLHKYWESRGDA